MRPDISGAYLTGADLSDANLTIAPHSAALRGAKLVKANLSEAIFIGDDRAAADMMGADTTGAIFEHT
ncbi:MAG: pentapeptide repeat-containing protein [Halobacteriota archaeon]